MQLDTIVDEVAREFAAPVHQAQRPNAPAIAFEGEVAFEFFARDRFVSEAAERDMAQAAPAIGGVLHGSRMKIEIRRRVKDEVVHKRCELESVVRRAEIERWGNPHGGLAALA